MDDFYATLGVPPNATAAEIKNRYRFLAHAYHPDKFSSDAHKRDAGEAFKKVNEAFQTLSDPSLRAGYDRQRASGPANEPKSSPPPPRPAPQPPPPRQQQEPTRSGGLSARTIVWLVIAAGIGVAVLRDKSGPDKPRLPSYEEVTAPQKDDWGGIQKVPPPPPGSILDAQSNSPKPAFDPSKPFEVVKESPAKPVFDPTTAKPVFDPDAYLASKASPKTATSHGPREDYASQPATKERPSPESKAPPTAKPFAGKAAQDYFTIGSTIDEVLAIQGTPTSVSGNWFRYGTSAVIFEEGKVRSWDNSGFPKLKVKLLPPR